VRIEERSLVGITSWDSIHRLLELAGFVVKHEWGNCDRMPFTEGDALLIVEAMRT
jgi:hypothetical protein